ncbi:DUF1793-domain-containing protein [Dichomitus squalens]|uniref:DUF1793-domain-containing protein n=1 Tax=Dichomitus squalens TaxID=114155 RepID=A0A4Q9MV35_9APHY|nr:DUF1793-domain-containing protein [Dichomitus squalens]
MRLFAISLILLNAATALGAATWNAEPFNPASVPLAVRSPYLSAWLAQGQGTALNDAWPTFWTGSILGWAGLAKVDGQAYIWMGQPGIPNVNINKATQQSLQITSTQSVFVMTAGPVDLTITFLSPIEPSDFVNQSLPLSYYSVSAASTDGKSHSVQVYADISAEWVSGDDTLIVNWATTTGDVLSHEVKLAIQTTYTEINDRIQQGSAFHSTLNTVGATFQTGEDVVVRAQFATNGTLSNTQDTSFRAVSDRWPVFAFAHDLGAVTSATSPVVYSIGHVRDPVVQYIIVNADTQARSSYFWTRFASIGDAISTFLNDYPNALARANAFDAQVKSDASKILADYASLVALSIRQAFGATEITVTKNNDGSLDNSNTLMFMKEISSDGNVNTVDVIYPSWPLFLYTNATLGKQLLLPLFEYQTTGQYPNQYSVHDMGAHYPNATGHNDGKDEAMPVEESGNMLIMTLSYAQRTGDLSLIIIYFSLLDQWTQFLITDSLIPANQLSTDDFAGALANQTNLTIKGIIGIQAMAEIAKLNDDEARASNYSLIAASYVQQWQKLATSSDGSHLTLSVPDDDESWGIAYNLYADKLLGTNIFPSSVYDMRTAWYAEKDNAFGVPLDTRHTYSKSDWQIWTAGTVTSTTVRDQFVRAVLNYASDAKNNQPLGDLYDTIDGTQVANSGHARPVVGGHLALACRHPAPPNLSSLTSSAARACECSHRLSHRPHGNYWGYGRDRRDRLQRLELHDRHKWIEPRELGPVAWSE